MKCGSELPLHSHKRNSRECNGWHSELNLWNERHSNRRELWNSMLEFPQRCRVGKGRKACHFDLDKVELLNGKEKGGSGAITRMYLDPPSENEPA